MKEIIAFFIVSGGVGFFNLYLAQETDFLYFGKYNKEERIAWLSIFTLINYSLIQFVVLEFNTVSSALDKFIIYPGITVITSILLSLLLPWVINKLIDLVRKLLNKGGRTHLPPLNEFFQDIHNYQIYVYDFEGNLINQGKIMQGTEERQLELSILSYPVTPDKKYESYQSFMKFLSQHKDDLSYVEYTDYDRKYHFIKAKIR